MDTFQKEIHRVSDAIARMNFLKSKNKKTSFSALKNVDTKCEEFKTLFKETKNILIKANTPRTKVKVEDHSKLSGFRLDGSNTFVHFIDREVT